jgi:RNA polymerase-binding transcription factor DksA
MDAQASREALHTRLATLTKREAALSKHLRGQDGRLEEDFSDRVSFVEMDEVIEQLDDDARAEIVAIQAALARLQEGTYGTCTGCGEDITAKRLEVLPHTAQCVSCAA